MKINSAILLQCVLLIYNQSVIAITIEMVTIGNPGNAPDMRYNLDQRPEGYGAVNYVYQIGKYEITAGQYTEFLNAVAKADYYSLYHSPMGDTADTIYGRSCNIQRTGSDLNHSYSVAADWADRPVNFVSVWDAARFCNWLHNGQPTGPQGLGTTEDGAYHDIGNQYLFGRNANAKFFIPTEDEWYKAAYHNKSAGLAASYFDYPTGTNSVPGNDITEVTNPGNNANFRNVNYVLDSPYFRTSAGEFELSDSPYGTFDQGGNVWEWNETNAYGPFNHWCGNTCFRGDPPFRGLRGGDSWNNANSLLASEPSQFGPSAAAAGSGFRIAAAAPVPEPTSLALFSIAAVMLGGSRLSTRGA